MGWSYELDFSIPHFDSPIITAICAIVFSAIMAATFFLIAATTFLAVRDIARECGQPMWRALPGALFEVYLSGLLCFYEGEDNVRTPLIRKNSKTEDTCQNV